MLSKEKLMDVYVLKRKGLSKNAIRRQTGLNWRTVAKYVTGDIERKAYDSSNRTSILTTYYPIIETWLDEDNYTGTWIYDRLKLMGYTGGYDLVKKKVREIKEKLTLKAYIRFETEPGRQAQVDFGEFKVADESGNTVETIYLFSMVLGYSRKPYHEFIEKRDMTSFLDCHINAFEHFGGVPEEILYDRMKNVLIRQLAGKLEWNREFYSFCLHYKFQPLVAPPYAAWVKGKVERPMHYVRENFWRGYWYRDLGTANRDLFDWTLRTESRIHGTTRERIDHRFEREKPALHPLPEHRFDTSLKIYRQVRKDCTVVYNGNYYVLPHRTVGKQVLLKVKDGMLGAFLDDKLLISYHIPDGKGHFVEDKRFYQELKEDITQIRRKYHNRIFQKGKAKKTLGIVERAAQTITVSVRSIDEYMHLTDREV
jgi:transposase